MPWVLKKTPDLPNQKALYVAPDGSKKSYTTLYGARRFATEEEADLNACGNERAVHVVE